MDTPSMTSSSLPAALLSRMLFLYGETLGCSKGMHWFDHKRKIGEYNVLDRPYHPHKFLEASSCCRLMRPDLLGAFRVPLLKGI
ncbi:hypothetical protein BDV09DRAFT_162508 [Aspergillus tetrazonus]